MRKDFFPGHKVAKLWCPNTEAAMRILSKFHLGSPSHVLIHTGPNDLRTQQEREALSLRAVTEKACRAVPHSKIVWSTLLPRKDFHPDTMQKVNVSISRDWTVAECSLWSHPPVSESCSSVHQDTERCHWTEEEHRSGSLTKGAQTQNICAYLKKKDGVGSQNIVNQFNVQNSCFFFSC